MHGLAVNLPTVGKPAEGSAAVWQSRISKEGNKLKTTHSVKIHATSIVRVEDFQGLHVYWRSLSRSARFLVGKLICTRLTTEQYNRLPKELKARLKVLAWA